jgi:hypothetical protein
VLVQCFIRGEMKEKKEKKGISGTNEFNLHGHKKPVWDTHPVSDPSFTGDFA